MLRCYLVLLRKASSVSWLLTTGLACASVAKFANGIPPGALYP
jgi:hypothetical protein